MKIIWTGIIVFIGWGIFSNYWYVCKVHYLCGDQATENQISEETYPAPDTTLYEESAENDKKQSLLRSIEETVIYFAFDSSLVLNDLVLHELTENVEILSPNKILLEGYTCNIGTEKYNRNLGKRRADHVKTALINQGIPQEKISTISYGEENPALPNTSEKNRKQNRRVEIIIVEK